MRRSAVSKQGLAADAAEAGLREAAVERCVAGARAEAGQRVPLHVPGVDVLAGVQHDLGLEVAVDVADRGDPRALLRASASRARDGVGLLDRVAGGRDRVAAVEGGDRRAVGVEDGELAAGARLDHVELVVAVDVVEARRDLAARARDVGVRVGAGADRPRPAVEVAVVLVGEEGLAVAAEVVGVAVLLDRQPDLEGVALGIGIRVGVGGPGAGGAPAGRPASVETSPSQFAARSSISDFGRLPSTPSSSPDCRRFVAGDRVEVGVRGVLAARVLEAPVADVAVRRGDPAR